jgi:MFS transporter, DHA1 family, tetracycline resistance protein
MNAFIILVLFISRMIDGFTGGNITVAQAYISDVTDESSRARGIGMIGSAFGLGFIIGPAVGGFLSQWGYNVPAIAAGCLALLNLISISIFLPESLSNEMQNTIQTQQKPFLTLHTLTDALSRPKVGPLLRVRFFLMMAFSMFMTVFVLFAQQRLDLTTRYTGLVLTFIGLYSILVQGVGVGILTKHIKDNNLIFISLCLMLVGYLGWVVSPNLVVMLIAVLPMAGGGWIASTILTSGITKAVSPSEVGGVLGISTSVENITRVISPTIGGLLFGSLGMLALGVFCAVMILFAIWMTLQHIISIRVKIPIVSLPVENVECDETGD